MTAPAEITELKVGQNKDKRQVVTLDREMAFTQTYIEYEHAHIGERELACLRTQTPRILTPLQDGDLFAGRIDRALVGLDQERGGLTEAAYFARMDRLEELRDAPDSSDELREQASYLIDFWTPRQTYTACRAALPATAAAGLPSDAYYTGMEISYPMYGLGGPCVDYDKLVRLGLPGLRAEIDRAAGAVAPDSDQTRFYDTLTQALDLIAEAALRYADHVHALCTDATPTRAVELSRIESDLRDIPLHAPQSYSSAIQLVWLYALVALPRNYGRLDVTLGDLLVQDLDSGALTRERALDLTAGLWKLIRARGDTFNGRVIIGGRGRRNEDNANRFALLTLDVQERLSDVLPQLSLRWYRGMPEELWDRTMEVLSRGSTFPIIYSDDTNVPAVAAAFNVDMATAEQYTPYGCGEYVLEGLSIGSPDAALNVLKALDVTLRNGVDGFDGSRRGLALGRLKDYATFDDLKAAVERQLDTEIGYLADAQASIYRSTAAQVSYPLLSLLYDDCIARGKPLLDGGVRYCGGTLESFGNNTAADALTAIKRTVYDRGLLSPDELMAALDDDFVGHEQTRQILKAQPTFGNDDPEADAMSTWLNGVVCESAQQHGRRVGLHSFLVVLINNGDSVLFGKATGASADGRRRGQPVSNGNQPGAGNDRSGLTALLNSMARLDPSLHAGATHNVKLSRQMFSTRRAETDALLKTYFGNGGTQAMVTVTDRRELERALEHPEEYANLIVRVGGYSERFVDLPRDIQLEVMRRTLY